MPYTHSISEPPPFISDDRNAILVHQSAFPFIDLTRAVSLSLQSLCDDDEEEEEMTRCEYVKGELGSRGEEATLLFRPPGHTKRARAEEKRVRRKASLLLFLLAKVDVVVVVDKCLLFSLGFFPPSHYKTRKK